MVTATVRSVRQRPTHRFVPPIRSVARRACRPPFVVAPRNALVARRHRYSIGNEDDQNQNMLRYEDARIGRVLG